MLNPEILRYAQDDKTRVTMTKPVPGTVIGHGAMAPHENQSHTHCGWVAAARPKGLPLADGQTIGKPRLPLPPEAKKNFENSA
jgi:hypothetical protein